MISLILPRVLRQHDSILQVWVDSTGKCLLGSPAQQEAPPSSLKQVKRAIP